MSEEFDELNKRIENIAQVAEVMGGLLKALVAQGFSKQGAEQMVVLLMTDMIADKQAKT